MRLYQSGALLTGARREFIRRVLDAATLRAARALGVGDRTGTIGPGKDANLIAVRRDPRTDIWVLNHLEVAVARGTEHRPAPYRARRPAGPPPGAGPAIGRPMAAASALAAPAGPRPR